MSPGLRPGSNVLPNCRNNDLCLQIRFTHSFNSINPTIFYCTYLKSGCCLFMFKAVYQIFFRTEFYLFCHLPYTHGLMCGRDKYSNPTSIRHYIVVVLESPYTSWGWIWVKAEIGNSVDMCMPVSQLLNTANICFYLPSAQLYLNV